MHRTPSERRSRVAKATTGVFCTILTLLFTLIAPGCGGGTRGTNISGTGTVRSSNGDPVSDATVANPTGQTSETNDDGEFSLGELGLRSGTTTSLTVTTPEGAIFQTQSFNVTGDTGTLAITLPEAGQQPIAEAVFIPESPSAGDDSRGDNIPEDDSFFEPQPTPTPVTGPGDRPTPTPSARPTRPTPSPGGGGEEILAQCVAERFTVRGIPDLSCEQPCLNDPGSYVTDCRNFISYLSQVFLPYCANEPCADECELTQLLFSDTRTGAIVAQGYENANCGRTQQGAEGRNEHRPISR